MKNRKKKRALKKEKQTETKLERKRSKKREKERTQENRERTEREEGIQRTRGLLVLFHASCGQEASNSRQCSCTSMGGEVGPEKNCKPHVIRGIIHSACAAYKKTHVCLERTHQNKKSTSSNSIPSKKTEHTDFFFSCGNLLLRRAWHVMARSEQSKTMLMHLRNHPKCDVRLDGLKGCENYANNAVAKE